MVIHQKILKSAGAISKNYLAKENIFTEGESAQYYFQIVSGSVKMNNYDASGKEHIQNHLEAGECLGESFLFIDHQYPMNAVAINSCEVLSLKKKLFISLMQKNPKMCFEINKNLSKKLHSK